MYVCVCQGLTERDVRAAARAGNTSAEALVGALGLNHPRCCGRCARGIDRFVALARIELLQPQVSLAG